jgi:hypothetical protein
MCSSQNFDERALFSPSTIAMQQTNTQQRPGNAQIWRAADRVEVRAVLANLARLARDR